MSAHGGHVFVGAGDGPCTIVMVGTRVWKEREEEIIYPVNDAAAKYGASVETTTPTLQRRTRRLNGASPTRTARRPAGPLIVSEARLETLPEGLGAEGAGWFVLNARDAAGGSARGSRPLGRPRGDGDFEQLGIASPCFGPASPAACTTARRVRRTSSSSQVSACS